MPQVNLMNTFHILKYQTIKLNLMTLSLGIQTHSVIQIPLTSWVNHLQPLPVSDIDKLESRHCLVYSPVWRLGILPITQTWRRQPDSPKTVNGNKRSRSTANCKSGDGCSYYSTVILLWELRQVTYLPIKSDELKSFSNLASQNHMRNFHKVLMHRPTADQLNQKLWSGKFWNL